MNKLLTPDNIPFIILLGLGFGGVGAISMHVFGWIPLHITALAMLLPGWLLAVVLCLKNVELRELVQKGMMFGILAVLLYDMSRLPFLMMGWGDFIPKIGQWLLVSEDPVSPIVGYAWRYILNGGGLGVAFMMFQKITGSRKNNWLTGLNYGLFVFLGLLMTLIIAPAGQSTMFKITMISFWGGLVGHIIYGLVLGLLSSRVKASSATHLQVEPSLS